jgi:Skp family chaperone for outer membrane proteins
MKHLKKLVILAAILAVAGYAFAEAKIVVIDMLKVRNETKIGKDLTTKMESFRKAKTTELTTKRDEILNIEKDLQSKASALSDAKKLEMRQRYEKLSLEYKELLQKSQQEVDNMGQQILKDYNEALMPILQKMCKEKGYDLVISRDITIFSVDSMSITDEFIKLVNAAPQKPQGGK